MWLKDMGMGRMLMKIKELKEVLNNLNTYIKENANEY